MIEIVRKKETEKKRKKGGREGRMRKPSPKCNSPYSLRVRDLEKQSLETISEQLILKAVNQTRIQYLTTAKEHRKQRNLSKKQLRSFPKLTSTT